MDLDVNMEDGSDDGGDENDDNEGGFIYVLGNGDVNVIRYESRGGQWYNSKDGTLGANIDRFRRKAFRRFPDWLARFWNTRVDMRLLALQHMKESSYDDKLTEAEYVQYRNELEDSRQISEYVDIRYIDDRTQGWMFTASKLL